MEQTRAHSSENAPKIGNMCNYAGIAASGLSTV